jgi:TRAP-type C4-dicarboxylate transport system substrate-binding protein
MNERVNLDFDQDSKQFYASLDPDDKPALEKHLNRVLQKQQPAKSKPEKEKSEEIERD